MAITHSDAVVAIFTALSAFQGEVVAPKKASMNEHFGKAYADLADVWDVVRAPLAKNGLALVQFAETNERTVKLTSLLTHKSGEWLRSELEMPVVQWTPQGLGSAISYARRYCAMAILGIAAEDDDGEHATRSDKPGQRAERKAATSDPKKQDRPASQEPDKKIQGKVDEYGLNVPASKCPIVTKEDSPNKGKSWADLPGPLVEKMYGENGDKMSEVGREWCEYLMSRRQARKAKEAREAAATAAVDAALSAPEQSAAE